MKNQTLAITVGLLIAGPIYAQSGSSSGVGPFVRAEAGFSKAVNPNFRDDNPSSPNCFLIAASGPTCTGELNKLGNGRTLGVGVGYRLPGGIRADVSYNRRSGFELKGADPAGTSFDPPVKTDTVMVNGTFDIPVKLGSVKPYIGLGIGRTKNDMKPINWFDGADRGTLTGGKKNDTAWQFTLGGDIDLTGGWVLELAYRYTDLGKIVKNAGPDQVPSATTGPFNASGITGSGSGKLRTNELLMAVRFGF
jgi:opacity protein-like surface antigen